MYYRNAAAAIVVYDITSEVTFEVLQEWITELRKLGPENIVLAIAGNKCDLEEKREVKRREGEGRKKLNMFAHTQLTHGRISSH